MEDAMGNPGSPGDAAVTAEIMKKMDEIIAAAEKADVEGTFALLTRDSGAVFYLNNRHYDLDSLLAQFRSNYERLRSQRIRVIESRVKVLGPEAAVWIGHGEGRTESTKGLSVAYSFTETWVWEKIEGKWVVTHYHESSG
jgi:hypothetical protein